MKRDEEIRNRTTMAQVEQGAWIEFLSRALSRNTNHRTMIGALQFLNRSEQGRMDLNRSYAILGLRWWLRISEEQEIV